ncbi:MAG: hypothetical protein RIA65_02675 [Woeseia sp.]
MELLVDNDSYGEIQPWFVYQLISRIKEQLEIAGLNGAALKDATTDMATVVCSEIDGAGGFQVGGTEITPYLAFSAHEDYLLYPGSPSYLSEYASRVIDELFEDD